MGIEYIIPETTLEGLSKDDLKFREKWITFLINNLDDKTEKSINLISETFDNTFTPSIIKLYNSVYNESYSTTSTKYFLYIKDKNIINENGVTTFKHEVKSSVIMEVIDGGIKGRQIQKKKKQNFIKNGEYMEADNAAIFEYVLKVLINGAYGLHLYPGSPLFNVTLGATCTAAARNMVAVAAIVIELLEGGFRNYQVQAHLKVIEFCKKQTPELVSKYDLPEVSVEEVLRILLGDYYEGYYAISFLRHQLEKLDKDVLKVIAVKNNIYRFMELPRVKYLFSDLMRIQRENPEAYLVNPKRDELYKDHMAELYKMSSELLYGFYYYDGDYDGKTGIYYDTLVDIIENIKRKKIVLMDTDSCVTSFQREVNYFLKKYSGQYNEQDKKITDGVVPSIICWIYMGCIDKALTAYVMELGVDYEYAKKVELEMEHMMEQLQLSLAKKSYGFIPVITDFFLNKFLKLKLRGVSMIKSNFNKEFCHIGAEILKKHIMVPIDKLDYGKIITEIKNGTKKAVDILKSDDFILNKRTLLKISSETLSYSEHKMKSVNLWNMLYPEDTIEYPGSFGVVLLSLNENKILNLKNNFPREFEIINKFSLQVTRYKQMMSMIKKIQKGGIKYPSNTFRCLCNAVSTSLSGREHLYIPEVYSTLIVQYAGLKEEEKKEFIKLFKFEPLHKTEDDNKNIIENVKKIAIPLELNTVPQLLKYNNYELLDIVASSEVEHVLSPLAATISLVFSKNKDKRNTITSILNSF